MRELLRLAFFGSDDEEVGWDLGDLLAAALGALRFRPLVLGKVFRAGERRLALLAAVLVRRHGPSSVK